MEFSISKEELIKGLSKTQSIIEKKTTLPILSNVLISANSDNIEITATDLEVGVKGIYDAEVKSEGSITIGAKKLFEIIRELPEDKVNFKLLENNMIELICSNANFKILGLAADDFPILPSYDKTEFVPFPAKLLAEMIEKVQHATSLDETRYYLNGVFFATIMKEDKNYLRMVATDGHRLSMIDKDVPENTEFSLEDGCIIPRKGVNELRKALSSFDGEAKIHIKDRNLIVVCDSLLFIIRLIDENFPDYNQVIPSGNDKIVTCSRDQLNGSLRRISLLSSEMGKGVKFELKKKEMKVSTKNPELGEAMENMVVGYDGEDIEVGFNAKYFLDILGVVTDEDVVLKLADPLSPGLIQVPSDPGFSAVIMPMRM